MITAEIRFPKILESETFEEFSMKAILGGHVFLLRSDADLAYPVLWIQQKKVSSCKILGLCKGVL